MYVRSIEVGNVVFLEEINFVASEVTDFPAILGPTEANSHKGIGNKVLESLPSVSETAGVLSSLLSTTECVSASLEDYTSYTHP